MNIKRGMMLILGIIIFSSLTSASSLTLTSWRADNISGYICEDSQLTKAPLRLIFEKIDPDPTPEYYPKLSTLEVLKDLNINPSCGMDQSSFSFNINIFSLSKEDQQRILKKFPIEKLTAQSEGSIESKYDLNFSCTYENQTIMKLTSPFNSHVYLGNQSTREELNISVYPICFERVFGYLYEGDNEIYPSTCTSPVLYKHKQENTHVSTSYSSDYSKRICYADLICTSRISTFGSDPCINEEKQVASLFYNINSHVSDKIDDNYNIKICCKTNYKPNPFSETGWYNMLGQEITNANNCSWVQIKSWGEAIINKQVNFNIFKLIAGNPIIHSKEITILELSKPQIAWQTSISSNYKFNTTLVSDPSQTTTSNQLEIKEEYTQPNYNIQVINPLCGNNFTINQPIDFKIFINTSELLINGRIDFGDGTISYFSNLGSSVTDFTHTYQTDGTKLIWIETRPSNNLDQTCPDLSYLTKRKIINLIIVDPTKAGEYVAACIDSPEDMSQIKEAIVFCNATSTRALNYTPPGFYREIPKENISFEWIFSDNTIHTFKSLLNETAIPQCYDTLHEYLNSDGSTYNQQITCLSQTKGWLFTKYFQEAGDNSAELKAYLNKT